MDIDRSFVSVLVQSDLDAFKYAVKNVPIDLVQGTERKIYRWIIEYYRLTKGHMPTPVAVAQQFKGYKFLRSEERVEFFEVKFRERFEYRLLTKGVTEMGNMLFSEDIDGAKEAYREIGSSLGKSSVTSITSVQENLLSRKETYLEAKKNKGKLGYYMGVPSLDNHMGGLQKEFVIIMGDSSIGKTFLTIFIACNIWKELPSGIVFISNEMDTGSIEKRIDSTMCKFDHGRYRKGRLNAAEEIRLRDLSKTIDKLPPFHVINGAGRSVSEIEYDVIALAPSLLVVDGIYLTDMGKNDRTKDTMAASQAYQILCKKYEIPTIATSQIIDGKTKYARALGEDADAVIHLWDNQALRDTDMKALTFKKIREEQKDKTAYMNWNFATWDFGEADTGKGHENSAIFNG